ncbi:MAG: SRPBCC domain-containing protein [Dehalococcoidia bacterium]|nr:SRPBCC domain-containing protein [Dehalococcoidia bacterium]
MINPKTTATPAGERELLIEREFAAPRELVFKAWTERDRLMQWWGPPTWPIDYCTVDLRVGGAWHYRMRGPAGEEGWGKGVYREIMPSSRLVYSDYFSDEDGTEIPSGGDRRNRFRGPGWDDPGAKQDDLRERRAQGADPGHGRR